MSQRVRASIEGEFGLSAIINKAFQSGGLCGNIHTVLILGNIGGNHAAIRTFNGGLPIDYMQADLEYFARRYAESIGGRYRIPRFAIGALLGIVPYLFTEDLTEGGKYPIVPTNDKGGTLEPIGQEVLFDFGLEEFSIGQNHHIKEEMLRQPLFFAPENLLRVK